jgi:hypothetical protein
MIDVGTGMEVEELRFIDEAFAKICNMINDLSLEVKVQAAKVLVCILKQNIICKFRHFGAIWSCTLHSKRC